MSSVSDSYTVTSQAARRALITAFKAKRPVFLWGPPGIGKSEVIAEIAEEMGGLMIDLRMAQMDPTDIRGIPFLKKDADLMDWAPPIDLPSEELAAKYPIILLFLDEMNSAPPSVQASGYQLVLNRAIGRYRLPDNVVIVAAGNRDGDRGVTYRMPSPLANRFVHIEMRADFQSWQDWAIRKGVHKDVVGYLSATKQDLYDFEPKSASRAFATPRSWVFVSDLLQNEADIDRETMFTLVAGCVGEGLAAKFMAHRKFMDKMPRVEDILSGKVTELETKEVSAMYSLTVSMCYELRDAMAKGIPREELTSMTENFLDFMMKNFETELVIMGSKTAMSVYGIPFSQKMRNFSEFHKKFGTFIKAASGITGNRR